MRRLTSVVAVVLCTSLAHGADQTILGQLLLVRDPSSGIDPAKRRLVVQGKELASHASIVGDPTLNGASLSVFLDGATSGSQVFPLPQGSDPSSGKPFWTSTSTGFAYRDPKGVNGAVRTVRLKGAGSRIFKIRVATHGRLGGVTLTPPDPGTSGCMRLDIVGGDSYHVVLPPAPDSTIKRNDAKTFLVKNALTEGFCGVI